MTLDGGWALIIATIVGIVFTGMIGLGVAHITRLQADIAKLREDLVKSHEHAQDSHIELLEFKAYVEREFVPADEFKDLAKAIFEKLDNISEKLSTKADKLVGRSHE